jgi:hypothetical protein
MVEKRPFNWQSILTGFGVTVLGLILGMLSARETGFRVPLALERFDWWTGVELQSLILLIICFGLGFLARHFMNWGSLDELRDDIEDLRVQFREAGNLRSRTHEHKQPRIYAIPEEFLPERGEPSILAQKRKVRVIKLSGENSETGAKTSVIGLEEAPPEVGNHYVVIIEQGEIFCTSPVSRISSRYIQTKNSLYEIELINEEWAEKNYRYDKTGPIY